MTPVPPWEPPIAGTEVEHLLGALDRQRWTFRWKVDGLDDDGLDTRVGASSLSIRWLLEHLTDVELRLGQKVDGAEPGAPLAGADALGRHDDAVARSRARLAAALADGGLDRPVHVAWPDGRRASLRRLVCDMIEEYARHTGHADLLREAVDGRVGEDPPEDWRPSA